MNEEDRPRERLAKYGPETLSNVELLAIIIRTGTRDETAVDLANQLLSGKGLSAPGAGGLTGLAAAKTEDLCQMRGIGPAKAVQIQAALELGRRLSGAASDRRSAVSTPAQASSLVMNEMRFLDREHFRIIILNTKNMVLGVELVSVGSLNSTVVHPREVFKTPLKRSAAAVILVHNHPSGDPTPSQEDIDLTCRLVEAGKVLGINVLDHLIIGDGSYISLKERGLVF
ncbi:MAG: RadC family protein [bacterium]